VYRISIHATAEAVPPEFPVAGANFDHEALQSAGWFCIGARDRGDDADLDSASIGVVPIREGVNIRAAGALTNQDYIQRHNGISEITFTCYDATGEVFALDSSVLEDTENNGLMMRTAQRTYRAMLVEIDGIRADYYPRVALYVTNEPGGFGPGDDAVCKYEFTGIVTATDDIRSGQLKIHYQPAGT